MVVAKPAFAARCPDHFTYYDRPEISFEIRLALGSRRADHQLGSVFPNSLRPCCPRPLSSLPAAQTLFWHLRDQPGCAQSDEGDRSQPDRSPAAAGRLSATGHPAEAAAELRRLKWGRWFLAPAVSFGQRRRAAGQQQPAAAAPARLRFARRRSWSSRPTTDRKGFSDRPFGRRCPGLPIAVTLQSVAGTTETRLA